MGVPRARRTITDVVFPSGDGECAGTLYLPGGDDQDSPGVVMCHGFSLTRNDGLSPFAEQFAAAGIAALTFDFRHLGDSTGRPRQLVDDRQQCYDLSAGVSALRSRAGIDADRIAVWGFSQGGGVAIQAAAKDPRIAAVVALCPMADGLAFTRACPPVAAARLITAAIRDRVSRQPVTVPVIGPPGSKAVLTQPAAHRGVNEVLAPGTRWRNAVCAAPFLRAMLFRPVRAAHRVQCPLLVGLAEHDTLVPLDPIMQVADRAPRGELQRYSAEHFDAFGTCFASVVADHLEFLGRHLVEVPPG